MSEQDLTTSEPLFRPAVDVADLLSERPAAPELLGGIEIAAGAYERPGAAALVTAADELFTADPNRQNEVRMILAAALEKDKDLEMSDRLIERARHFVDPGLSEQMSHWMDTTDDPAVAATRQKLGITKERPYDILVLSIDLKMDGTADEFTEAQKAWSNALSSENGEVPTIFACKPSDNRPATIVVDSGTAHAILDPTATQYAHSLGRFRHEYGHAQRDIMTANGIGQGEEELMAARAAGGVGGYSGNLILTTILNGVTGGHYIKTFEDAMAGRASMNDVYELVRQAAGPQAVLALAAIPPAAPQYALPDYAKPMVHEDESSTMAVYRNITERLDPGKLAAGLSETNPLVAKWTMEYAMANGVALHRQVVEALASRLDEDEDPQRYLGFEGWSGVQI